MLSFEIEFAYINDRVYIAHSYPYTYSDLQRYLEEVQTEARLDRVRASELCRSNAGNAIHEVVISNFTSTAEEVALRKAVVLAGRVHPGETQGSWMIEGVIDFLISDAETAKYLRDNFVFKIVPMQNPDGVIIGNYRCSLTGADLNRKWHLDDSLHYPGNYHIKQMI